ALTFVIARKSIVPFRVHFQRQFHGEFRPLADDTFHANASLVLLDDLTTHAETQAAAAVTLIVRRFRSVERLEDEPKLFGRNADAGVADRDFRHVSLGVFTQVDRKPAAVGHCLAGIDDEVQEDLLNLAAHDRDLGPALVTLLDSDLMLAEVLV